MLSLYCFSLQKYFCIDNANLIKNFKSTKNFYSKALSTNQRSQLFVVVPVLPPITAVML